MAQIKDFISATPSVADSIPLGQGTNTRKATIDQLKTLITADVNASLSEKANQSDLNTTNANLAQLSNPNLLINGDFQVWQRGTTFTGMTSGVKYNSDRWYTHSADTSFNISKTSKGLSITKTNTTSYWSHICQVLETELANKLCGKYITLSVKVASVGTNVSAGIYLGVPSGNSVAVSMTLVSGLNSITYKVPDTITSSIGVAINLGICVANTNLEVEWVKLEIGNKATPFVPRLYGEELALCQRYYECYMSGSTLYKSIATSNNIFDMQYNVEKRIVPTVKLYSFNGVADKVSLATFSGNSYSNDIPFGSILRSNTKVIEYLSGTTFVKGDVLVFQFSADAEIY